MTVRRILYSADYMIEVLLKDVDLEVEWYLELHVAETYSKWLSRYDRIFIGVFEIKLLEGVVPSAEILSAPVVTTTGGISLK